MALGQATEVQLIRSLTKLTSANGARGGTYTAEQLRVAIDYIIYHGATASQEKDAYGYTGWKARHHAVCAVGG